MFPIPSPRVLLATTAFLALTPSAAGARDVHALGGDVAVPLAAPPAASARDAAPAVAPTTRLPGAFPGTLPQPDMTAPLRDREDFGRRPQAGGVPLASPQSALDDFASELAARELAGQSGASSSGQPHAPGAPSGAGRVPGGAVPDFSDAHEDDLGHLMTGMPGGLSPDTANRVPGKSPWIDSSRLKNGHDEIGAKVWIEALRRGGATVLTTSAERGGTLVLVDGNLFEFDADGNLELWQLSGGMLNFAVDHEPRSPSENVTDVASKFHTDQEKDARRSAVSGGHQSVPLVTPSEAIETAANDAADAAAKATEDVAADFAAIQKEHASPDSGGGDEMSLDDDGSPRARLSAGERQGIARAELDSAYEEATTRYGPSDGGGPIDPDPESHGVGAVANPGRVATTTTGDSDSDVAATPAAVVKDPSGGLIGPTDSAESDGVLLFSGPQYVDPAQAAAR